MNQDMLPILHLVHGRPEIEVLMYSEAHEVVQHHIPGVDYIATVLSAIQHVPCTSDTNRAVVGVVS